MTGEEDKRIRSPALFLTVAIAMGWVVCFWPARVMNGPGGVKWLSIAAICCLIPGWLVVYLTTLSIFRNDIDKMLAQMAVRFTSVVAVVLVAKWMYPSLGIAEFYGWVMGFYCLALVIEVRILQSQFKG